MSAADKPGHTTSTTKWNNWYWAVAIGLIVQMLLYYALTILFS